MYLYEHFAQLASNKPLLVHVTEDKPVKQVNVKKLFVSTPIEVLTYSIVVPDAFKTFVFLDQATWQLEIKARKALNSDYKIEVFATNQYKKTSPAAIIEVKETFITPPVRAGKAFPGVVDLNELNTRVQFNLAEYYYDLQKLPLSFTVVTNNSSASVLNFAPTTNILTITSLSRTIQYEVYITTSNGSKSIQTTLFIKEEFVLPPTILKRFPSTTYTLGVNMPNQAINLMEYFIDAQQNASLKITQGIQTLAFSVSATPADMQSALTLNGAQLTIRTLTRQQLYTVTVIAVNRSGKSVSMSLEVQDTKPIDCQVGPWSSWSGCTATCGGGWQSRTRSIVTPAAYGGKACTESLNESQQCNTHSCMTHCSYSINYGSCSANCGTGSRYNTYVIHAQPTNGGNRCPQEHGFYDNCLIRHCPPPTYSLEGRWTVGIYIYEFIGYTTGGVFHTDRTTFNGTTYYYMQNDEWHFHYQPTGQSYRGQMRGPYELWINGSRSDWRKW